MTTIKGAPPPTTDRMLAIMRATEALLGRTTEAYKVRKLRRDLQVVRSALLCRGFLV